MKKVLLKGGEELLFRKATEEDAQRMANFKQCICKETDFLSFGENEIEITAETERETIRSENSKDNSVIFIAVVNEAIAGFVTFKGGSRIRKRHAGELGISVRKQYWGLGIGNLLMQELIEWAKATRDIKKINLITRIDNEAALRLYKKYGFQEEGVLTRDLYIGGHFYDAVMMGLSIH